MPVPLELSYYTDDDDVFTLHIPKDSELEDVYFVLDNMEALTKFVEAFRGLCVCVCRRDWMVASNTCIHTSLACAVTDRCWPVRPAVL